MDNDGNSRLAAEIRAEIARQRLSARRIAAKLGKPPSTVSRWVNGDTPLTLDLLEPIARALNVSVVDLVARAYDKAAVVAKPDPDDTRGASPTRPSLRGLPSTKRTQITAHATAGRSTSDLAA